MIENIKKNLFSIKSGILVSGRTSERINVCNYHKYKSTSQFSIIKNNYSINKIKRKNLSPYL